MDIGLVASDGPAHISMVRTAEKNGMERTPDKDAVSAIVNDDKYQRRSYETS